MSELNDLLREACVYVESREGPLSRWFHGGRIKIIGPWRIGEGARWLAIAEPYNATGEGFDREIEGVGSSPEVALAQLLRSIERRERDAMLGGIEDKK